MQVSNLIGTDSSETLEAHSPGRIRKVKCDEGRPACRRCVSTGRVCDGYGVWGGGGNYYGSRQPKTVSKNDKSFSPRPHTSMAVLVGTSKERLYFEWFTCRTAKKLPGAFVLRFWDTLLFQACVTEPAVLHAVLTLSAIHKSDGSRASATAPDEQEQFMLQHYTRAIRDLQPHFSVKARASVRIALIACFVFTCLEFLRGRFETAKAHLQNGLRVLKESQMPCSGEDSVLVLKPSDDPIDDWIAEAFSRLHVHVELFKQTYVHTSFIIRPPLSESPVSSFVSLNQAWQNLESLFHQIFHLTERLRQQRSLSPTHPNLALLAHQQYIQASLSHRQSIYKASEARLQANQDPRGLSCRLLYVYHTMAGIMAGTCLRPADDECFYDAYLKGFLSILHQSIEMWKSGSSTSLQERPPGGASMHMSKSLADIGWIAPLYYTAIKCRVLRIRLHAIRLIESASHREGMWDSRIASCVARKVLCIEEGELCQGAAADLEDDQVELGSPPRLSDCEVSSLPEENRVCELRVVLDDGVVDSVLVEYRHGWSAAEWKQIHVALGNNR